MEWIAVTLFTAIVTFIATNVDDILILTVFYSQVNRTFRNRHIVAGQYLGFSALVAISLIGFLGGLIIPGEWIGLLGVLPIVIGIRKFLQRNGSVEPVQVERLEGQAVKSSFLSSVLSRQTFSVAAVTFANGGDNIGIYTPLFANSNPSRLLIMLSMFFVSVGVWCALGYRLAKQPTVALGFARYGHIVVPLVLICLGIYILIESKAYTLLGF